MQPNGGLKRNRVLRGISQLFLCLSAVVLTSCVVTYKTVPVTDGSAAVSKQDVPIYYHVDPFDLYSKAQAYAGFGFDFPYPSRESYDELQRAFTDRHIFSQAIAASSPPEKGVYCAVNTVHTPQSKLAGRFNFASVFFLTALPAYSASSNDLLQFELYVDRELKKVYEYRVTKVKGTWIVLLPFAWINFFTTDRDEAFRAATHQFFLDAERDGYFMKR